MHVDLGAEQLLAAEKDHRKIAVEVKSFASPSEMQDLELAVGQFTVYHDVLARVEPDRELFLALNEEVYNNLFEEPIGEYFSRHTMQELYDLACETNLMLAPANSPKQILASAINRLQLQRGVC